MRRTHPHVFSWLIWSLVMLIGFAEQWASGTGMGAWVTFADGIGCVLIFALSFTYGEKSITMSDRISLGIALLGLVLWRLSSNPLWAAIFVTVADAFGFLPTFRKSFAKPQEETVSTYALVFISFALAFFVINTHEVASWLYPAYVGIANGTFALYIVIRRYQLRTA